MWIRLNRNKPSKFKLRTVLLQHAIFSCCLPSQRLAYFWIFTYSRKATEIIGSILLDLGKDKHSLSSRLPLKYKERLWEEQG